MMVALIVVCSLFSGLVGAIYGNMVGRETVRPTILDIRPIDRNMETEEYK